MILGTLLFAFVPWDADIVSAECTVFRAGVSHRSLEVHLAAFRAVLVWIFGSDIFSQHGIDGFHVVDLEAKVPM